jgi:two-component system NarL family response regulator
VLALVGDGFTSCEIGKALWIAEDTVKSHVAHTLRALGARNRAHAVAIALRRGLLVDVPDLVA